MVVSPLAKYTNISPSKNTRTEKIDTITLHCMVAHMTATTCADYFAKSSTEASSNYCVGDEPGDIACSVPEDYRSWCSSSPENDQRAITIEIASDRTDPYAITDTAMNNVIELLVDVCKRNNIKELKWTGDKTGNMTAHRWFALKACPGDYIYTREAEIASKVNARLGNTVTTTPAANSGLLYKVQVGAFGNKSNAEKLLEEVKKTYPDAFIVQVSNSPAPENKNVNKKSIVDVAREVLDGKWGNGITRKNDLTAAGYDYNSVQDEVNRLLSGS